MIKKHNIIILACTMAIFACRDLVQTDFPEMEPVPVMNAQLIAGQALAFHISMAQKIDSTELEAVNNATVLLYANNQFADTLRYDPESGYYLSDTLARAGAVYHCTAEVPGYRTLESTDSIPLPLPVLNVSHVSYAGRDEEGTVFPMVKITFSNNPALRSYFEAKIRLIRHGEDSEAMIHNIVEPIILNEGLPIALFSNETISDTSYTLVLNYTTGSSSSRGGTIYYTNLHPFVIELRTVSYAYYRYKKQYYLYHQARYSNMLLSNHSAFPLYSNIENGYGILAGYSSFVSDTITPEPYAY